VSHSQVWGLWQDGQLYLGGVTNRAQVSFEREFLSILEALAPVDSTITPTPPEP
jgi:cytochrome c biogenesis protein